MSLHRSVVLSSVAVLVALVATSCASAADSDAEVLSAWVTEAFNGNVKAAAELLADDVVWVGLGNSAESFARGSVVYETYDLVVTCDDNPPFPQCAVTWNDLWTDQIPDLDQGELRVSASVDGGRIVAFREWVFSTTTRQMFEAQTRWLETNDAQALAEACDDDPANAPCSQLFVDTAADFVAER